MKVGVDLDGVCYDFHGAYRYMMGEYRGVDMPPVAEFWSHWDAQKAYGSTHDHAWMWSEGVDLGLFRYGHTITGTLVGLAALYEAGHDLVVITHRPERAVGDTLAWLNYVQKDSMFRFSGIHVFSNMEPKSTVDADVLIDDKPENLLDWVGTGRPAIKFQQPWNMAVGLAGLHPERGKLFTAQDWPEVVKWVANLSS